MTLPSSGTLDYNSIRAEFAGPSSNVTLSTYVRGGTYTYPVPANANITTGSTSSISVSNFYGAKGRARIAGFTAVQGSSGGKLPTTFRGAPNGNAFFDQSGYFQNQNAGNWSIYRSETNIAVNQATFTWQNTCSGNLTATAYDSSGNAALSCTTGSQFSSGKSFTAGGISGQPGATFSPNSAVAWPTSGNYYINDSG